jgi:transposase
MSKYKNFDKSFKKQAVQLALTSNQPIAKTAKELGVSESTLYSWVSAAKSQKAPTTNNAVSSSKEVDVEKLHEELLKLRKDNQRLKETCEILKKATAYFANDPKRDTHS